MLIIRNPRRRRQILLIYGAHSSLERMYGLAEDLKKYGTVTMPDLPGFGGMDSFYKFGEKPTLDAMADYLAAFCKLRYRNRRFTVMGMSYGFVVVTRMLQRYPELAKKVDYLISVVGFAHKDDFGVKRRYYWMMRGGTKLFSYRLTSAFIKNVALQPVFIKGAYRLVEGRHVKLADADAAERKKRIAFEIILWRSNDLRTYMQTGHSMFVLDLSGQRVDLPVYHISIDNDLYFNNIRVEEHMRTIFSDFTLVKTKMPAHAPSVVATAKEAAPYVPREIRQLLRKKA